MGAGGDIPSYQMLIACVFSSTCNILVLRGMWQGHSKVTSRSPDQKVAIMDVLVAYCLLASSQIVHTDFSAL